MGFNVGFSDPKLCCGALHTHAGLTSRALDLEERVESILTGATIVVNSAGCGAHLREVFARTDDEATKVVDVMEFIDENIDRLPLHLVEPNDHPREHVIIHDACHLRNLQRTHLATHRVLGRFYDTSPIPDDGLCCGAGGAYAIEQPHLARAIVARKFTALESVVNDLTKFVSSGNPGCLGHMGDNKPESTNHIRFAHPVQLVARMIDHRKRETT
jgi:glycolate oxidase iron-sulfur subunit